MGFTGAAAYVAVATVTGIMKGARGAISARTVATIRKMSASTDATR